jgi:hypothetical protein
MNTNTITNFYRNTKYLPSKIIQFLNKRAKDFDVREDAGVALVDRFCEEMGNKDLEIKPPVARFFKDDNGSCNIELVYFGTITIHLFLNADLEDEARWSRVHNISEPTPKAFRKTPDSERIKKERQQRRNESLRKTIHRKLYNAINEKDNENIEKTKDNLLLSVKCLIEYWESLGTKSAEGRLYKDETYWHFVATISGMTFSYVLVPQFGERYYWKKTG